MRAVDTSAGILALLNRMGVPSPKDDTTLKKNLFEIIFDVNSYIDTFKHESMAYIRSLKLNSPSLLESLLHSEGNEEEELAHELMAFVAPRLGPLTRMSFTRLWRKLTEGNKLQISIVKSI
jgi:hypothetical protein